MIEVKDLFFSYSKNPFIENMNFTIKDGEIFGFLGPSGAGKSTLQKILIGLLANYSGSARIDGTEVSKLKKDFYETIGVDFEYPSLYEKLTAKENLDYFASLYTNEKLNPMDLLKEIGLENDANKRVKSFSKGMKSRLNFIKALIHKPNILFLDEPTSGLDPSNARVMKDMILKEKAMGKTIILTTHNMEDATELCDRVAFIVDGKIKALDSPHSLIMRKKTESVRFSYYRENVEITKVIPINDLETDKEYLEAIKNHTLASIHSCEPNLGDIFREITGKKLI